MLDTKGKNKFLITTAIDYANKVIHIGHAYEKILADATVRYLRLIYGEENVKFVTGTDEHGITNQQVAKERGITAKEHVDDISSKDRAEIDALNVNYDRFIRTTDEDHKETAKEFYLKSFESGAIYKHRYEGFYCEGCESYKASSELTEDGKCPNHPTREIQKLEEENYFFRLSEFSDFLSELITSGELLVAPESKKKEMLAFIDNGIDDIPISRPSYKLSWGIPVPNDPDHVIYVWYDALINYYTYGSKQGFWDDDTLVVHYIGKDINRFHSLLWPSMLKTADIRRPDVVYAHGFLNLNGQKISKSLGNVIRPTELVEKYGADAVRYYFLKHGPITEDVDVSIEHFEEVYNADLANGIGNTVSRVAKLCEKSGFEFEIPQVSNIQELLEKYWRKDFRIDLSIAAILEKLTLLDKQINIDEPWTLINDDPEKKLQKVLQHYINELHELAILLSPIIPQTSDKIKEVFDANKISAVSGLFPRIQ